MSKVHVFPYGITLKEGGVIDIFPAAEAKFNTRSGEKTSLFLVIDSGAAISALPRSDADVLGIDVERGTPMKIVGISGISVGGWRHDVDVGLGEDQILIPLVFLDDERAPRVLGRAGIFNRYTIVFEEHKRRSALMNIQTSTSRKITKIIDGASE